jgi:hypothetical protein
MYLFFCNLRGGARKLQKKPHTINCDIYLERLKLGHLVFLVIKLAQGNSSP